MTVYELDPAHCRLHIDSNEVVVHWGKPHKPRPWPGVWTAYHPADATLVARAFVLAYNDERLTGAEHALVAHLRTEAAPRYPGVRHWSPMLQRWCVDFDPAEWAGAA